MRSERGRRWLTLLLLPAGLLAFRQLIVLLGSLLPVVDAQQTLTHARGIHPADLFYTQVPLAMAAEKEVRRRVEGLGQSAIIAASSDDEE